ncbi:MAG: hypothetical protein IPL32_10770 [Chloracidobacterium sp.]|nr:hypothetical protein [Chloracidobacterium sp.]
MNRIKNLLAVSIFSLLILGIPALASAQSRDRDYDDDDNRYGNYGGYNNGGYNNGNYGNSRSAIRDLKRHAKDFQRQLDRDLDNSRYNGTRREDQMNEIAERFKDAVNDLNNNGYNNDRNGNNRNNTELRRVFDLANQIDRTISRSNISSNSRNIWSGIRNDLQALGYNNRRGGSNSGGYGNGRGNNGQYNKPTWWPF